MDQGLHAICAGVQITTRERLGAATAFIGSTADFAGPIGAPAEDQRRPTRLRDRQWRFTSRGDGPIAVVFK